jgi:Cytochrome C oxidase, cbb3-type, subunit III
LATERFSRGRLATTICAVPILLLSSAACRQDMHDQPKYLALRSSTFFSDGSSARVPVAGTVARGDLREDALLYTGKEGEDPAKVFPFPIDDAVMARGHERFDIYCAPCHGRTGSGDGMIVQRGFTRPPSLIAGRLLEEPPGHFFEIITNGFGAMPDHAAQVKPSDRWAIIAYIRALQLAANAKIDDVPPAERARLQ